MIADVCTVAINEGSQLRQTYLSRNSERPYRYTRPLYDLVKMSESNRSEKKNLAALRRWRLRWDALARTAEHGGQDTAESNELASDGASNVSELCVDAMSPPIQKSSCTARLRLGVGTVLAHQHCDLTTPAMGLNFQVLVKTGVYCLLLILSSRSVLSILTFSWSIIRRTFQDAKPSFINGRGAGIHY